MQLLVPGRFASLTDCALNLAGAGLGLIYFRYRIVGLLGESVAANRGGRSL